jgi:hypothetical protein
VIGCTFSTNSLVLPSIAMATALHFIECLNK